jgi:hypothetical protein
LPEHWSRIFDIPEDVNALTLEEEFAGTMPPGAQPSEELD